MSLKGLFYAYILGGLTFIPLVLAALVYFTIYTSVPVGDPDVRKKSKTQLADKGAQEEDADEPEPAPLAPADINDAPKTRKAWLTMRRTFEESTDSSYVTLVRSFLDARSKDPKRSRPKDMWYVVLKANVLYLYEDEAMTECEGVIELGGHDVTVYPEGLMDGELFAKRNAICLKPKIPPKDKVMPSVTKEMHLEGVDVEAKVGESTGRKAEKVREAAEEEARQRDAAREQALDPATPWFIFVRSNVEMEDWYLALIHASDNPPQTPMLTPLQPVFLPADMNFLVNTLDEAPDVIPMRWLNALFGRVFFSFYRTHNLEAEIIRRLMKKLSKVKRPTFLTDINVTEVSVGNRAPTFSKPMLKELTKEGDASMEVHLTYKGEVRITVEATATINLGSRFKPYTVKLVLAAVLKEIEGNLLLKIKRPPSNRIWYAFTQTPRMVFEVEPIVSDRQITWSMITSTLESSMKAIIQESVVLPNMDDISFFESSAYMHRGGIWADAARREKPPTPLSEQQQPEDDAGSVASAPPPQHQHSADAEGVRGTQSAVELVSSSPPDGADLSWSSSFSAGDTAESSRVNQRRSWFSSVRSEDGRSLVERDEEDTPRGRSGTVDLDNKSLNPRSRSTPHPSDLTPPASSEGSSDDSHLQPPSLAPLVRGHGKSNSVEEYVNSDMRPTNDSSSSLPGSSRSGTGLGTSPTASTFLSTLRSRDKQAISNTAKETIRKWGANWSGLMKDKDKDAGGEDVPDHGSLISRLRPPEGGSGSGIGNVSHKARQSYAEVRAAVAERRGRERASPSPEPTATSTPIPIPEVRGRAVTMLPGLGRAPGQNGPLSRSVTADINSTPNRTSPTPSRTGTDLQTPEPPTPSPIHVQPQGKTMTIPGIHARHRGEVMSMGYVAPEPASTSPAKNKNQATTIQSVYRLWNSNGNGNANANSKSPAAGVTELPSDGASSSSSPSSSPSTSRTSTMEGGATPLPPVVSFPAPGSPAPTTASSPRPTPPPLPPRSARTPSLSHIARPDLGPPRLSGSESAASEALQTIANKDKDKRASLEFAGGLGSSPSSPPSRRATLASAGGEKAAAGGAEEHVSSAGGEVEVREEPEPPIRSPGPPPPLPPRRT